ncbi:type II toxin-antitoxin system RelE/ParE family toxin [Luedemannella flava]|uniref:Type II toxin-antitoxin system RelE/ParE family toxin n=1 Tax=Luedemannella flava TaxID=349316 RepID=A0ABN2LPS1_9ACTN
MTTSGPATPPTYRIEVDRRVAKLLGKLDRPVQARLIAAVATLSTDPRSHGVKVLTGHPGLLRIRVGDYRIVYTVEDDRLVVLVVHLGHRSDVHDAL